MTNQNRQIVELYKQGLTAPEVAEALGTDVEAVEFVLTHDKDVVNAVEKHMTDMQIHQTSVKLGLSALEEAAIRTIGSIMNDGDKDSVRLAAATYVTDHALGLKQPSKTSVNVNIFDFNDRLTKMKERRREMEMKTIDISGSAVKVA